MDGRAGQKTAWTLRGVAVAAALAPVAVPVIAGTLHGAGERHFAWFSSASPTGWWRLDPLTALPAYLHWHNYTSLGVPALVLVVALVTRGRPRRPLALGTAVLVALTAAAGAYLGPLCGLSGLAGSVSALPGNGWTAPALYLVAAVALALVARQGPGQRSAGTVNSDTT